MNYGHHNWVGIEGFITSNDVRRDTGREKDLMERWGWNG